MKEGTKPPTKLEIAKRHDYGEGQDYEKSCTKMSET